MKYFLDTEFHERPNTIDLISIAIVAEDGREFYAESSEFQLNNANDWLKTNVIPHLWSQSKDPMESGWVKQRITGGFMKKDDIKNAILYFIGNTKPEFWGYYADYDWVAFCWLFGAMVDLPKHFPMHCMDLVQFAKQLNIKKLPQQTTNEHHALNDARWNHATWCYIDRSAKTGGKQQPKER